MLLRNREGYFFPFSTVKMIHVCVANERGIIFKAVGCNRHYMCTFDHEWALQSVCVQWESYLITFLYTSTDYQCKSMTNYITEVACVNLAMGGNWLHAS
jgi:hypothetical protein